MREIVSDSALKTIARWGGRREVAVAHMLPPEILEAVRGERGIADRVSNVHVAEPGLD
jgi:hypothetical protein